MKKVLSLILALAMIIGMVPVIFAADTEEYASYKYVFTNAAHNDTKDKSNAQNLSSYVHNSGANYMVADVSSPWGYIARAIPYNFSRLETTTTCMNIVPQRKDKNAAVGGEILFNPDDMENYPPAGVCLQLKIDKPGTYRPVIEYLTQAQGPIVEIYLTSKSVARDNDQAIKEAFANITPEERIGVINTYGTTDEAAKAEMKAVDIENGGNYNLIFVFNGMDARNTSPQYYEWFSPVSFSLEGINPAEKELEYEYRFTMDEGVDIDKDGEGEDAGIPVITKADITISNPGCFQEGSVYILGMIKTNVINFTTYLSDKYNYLDSSKTDNWSFNSIYKPNNINLRATGADFNILANNLGGDDYGYLALKLEVLAPGTYDLSVDAGVLKYGGDFAVSFFPVSDGLSRTAMANGFVKVYDFDNSNPDNTNDKKYVSLGTVSVPSAGKYYLTLGAKEVKENADADTVVRGALLQGVKLTEVNNEPDVGNATASSITLGKTTVNVIAQDISGASIGEVKATQYSVGETVSETEANPGDGYTFLYWATGLGNKLRIASFDKTYNFTVEQGEAMWLRAVYSKDSAEKTSVVFYDANREEISRKLVNIGDKVETPDLPYMAGYGNATGWVNGITGETVSGDISAGGAQMLFVAEYPETVDETVAVTVLGGTVTNENPVYGTDVTVKAQSRENGTGNRVFSHWTKTVDGATEVVSFNIEYTFKAWEDCTLKAVYADCAPLATSIRKILIGNKDNTDVWVAEFVLSDATAKEKGFIFGGSKLETATGKVAMKSDDNHFSVTDDVDGDPVGYAILSDDTVIYSK